MMKLLHQLWSSMGRGEKRVSRGLQIVLCIGETEMLRNPELWF